MKDKLPPKTLQMLVTKKWLVESITSLGSGFLSHLTYQNEAIDPAVLTDIKNEQLKEKVLGEIIYQNQKDGFRVAEVEVIEINNFNTFIRFDFRLLKVSPFIRGKLINLEPSYLCYYKTNPA